MVDPLCSEVRVPRAFHFRRVHTVGEVHLRVDIDILEQREVALDRYLVLHAVVPVLYQVRLKQLVLFRPYRVRDLSGVCQRYFLVPSFFASHVFSAEGIESADVNGEVWQGDIECRVAHILCNVERPVQGHVQTGESG